MGYVMPFIFSMVFLKGYFLETLDIMPLFVLCNKLGLLGHQANQPTGHMGRYPEG